MSWQNNPATAPRALSACPAEIKAVVHDEYGDDPSRLKVGDRLMAYVAASNSTDTWEVIGRGTTLTQVMVRLIDSVPELGGT